MKKNTIIILVCLGMLSISSFATTYKTEVEDLVSKNAFQGKVTLSNYKHASGGVSVCFKKHEFIWKLNVRKPGTYYLWLRLRSGWLKDRFFGAKFYKCRLGNRQIHIIPKKETLDYHGDGHNFVWFRSEPLNLDKGLISIGVSSKWSWAHADLFLLTDNAGFKPAKGNVAKIKAIKQIKAFAVNPYASWHPQGVPKAIDGKSNILKLAVARNSTARGAFILYNDSKKFKFINLRSSSIGSRNKAISSSKIKLYTLHTVATQVLGVTGKDALLRLNRLGALQIAPNSSVLVWYMTDIPANTTPGEYKGTIVCEDQEMVGTSKSVVKLPVQLNVSSVILPEEISIAVFNWWGYWNASKEAWNQQLKHNVNTFKFIVYDHLNYRFDSHGNLIGDIDFSRLDTVIEQVKKVNGWILPEWYLHAVNMRRLGLQSRCSGGNSGAKLNFLSPEWKKAFITLVKAINKHLKEKGFPRQKVLHYIFDEYMGENFIKVGKLMRKETPKTLIFSDLDAPMKIYKDAASYTDVWCPIFGSLPAMAKDGRLAFMRSTGKQIWAYDAGYDQRAYDPYSRYLLCFWKAFKYKLQGCAFWKHQGDRVGLIYYPVYGSEPVTGRRYEAWAEGAEDYKLLKLLEKAAKSDSPQAGKARALLGKAVNFVCKKTSENNAARKFKAKILNLLERK